MQELLLEPDFATVKIVKIEDQHLVFKCLTGAARWQEDKESIEYSNLTSCQLRNNYIKVYERHFQRQGA